MAQEKHPSVGLTKLRGGAVAQNAQIVTPQPITYTLKFRLQGIDHPFSYVVNKDDWDRVSRMFEECEKVPTDHFWNFADASTGMSIHVCPQFVLQFQALFDAGQSITSPTSPEEDNRVTFHLDGLIEPLEYASLDEDEIAGLNFGLTLYDPDQKFIVFVDGDGELNAIRGDRVMLVECPDYYPAEVEDPIEPGIRNRSAKRSSE